MCRFFLLNKSKDSLYDYSVLAETDYGRIVQCMGCRRKVMIMFMNITQSLMVEDLFSLRKMVENIDVEEFFMKHPKEQRMHMRTDYDNLFFSFDREELSELKHLLSEAEFKIKLYENLYFNVN